MRTRYVSVDPRSDRFITVVKDDQSDISQLVLFEPSSPQPLLVQALNFVCQGVAWIPSNLDGHHHHDITSQDSDGKMNNTSDATLTSSDLAYLQPNHTIKIMSVVNANKLEATVDQETLDEPLPSTEERKLFNDAYGSRHQQKLRDTIALQSRIHANTMVRDDAVRGKRIDRKGQSDQHNQTDGGIFDVPSHILPRVDAIFGAFMDTLIDLKSPDDSHNNHTEELDGDGGMDWATTAEQHTVAPSLNHLTATRNVDTNINPATNANVSSLEPLPALDAYFASLTVDCPSSVPLIPSNDFSSSDDDNSDDEDIENIDW